MLKLETPQILKYLTFKIMFDSYANRYAEDTSCVSLLFLLQEKEPCKL